MSIVVPAILPGSRAELEAGLARLLPLPQVENVQIDIVDGVFASPPTWPYADHEQITLPRAERFRYDLDLMVSTPGRVLAEWVRAGAARLTLHVESTPNLLHTIMDVKREQGYEAGFTPGLLSLGVALNIETDIAVIEPLIPHIEYVQCMGIAHIGAQGQPFDTRVLAKVRALSARHPELTIQVDGGVSLATAPELLSAGVSRLIVGSAVMRADNVGEQLRAFEALGEQFGIFPR